MKFVSRLMFIPVETGKGIEWLNCANISHYGPGGITMVDGSCIFPAELSVNELTRLIKTGLATDDKIDKEANGTKKTG